MAQEDDPKTRQTAAVDDDDEPDEWYLFRDGKVGPYVLTEDVRDKRIFSTGCAGEAGEPTPCVEFYSMLRSVADENTALNNCFFEKKDWRACKTEVGQRLFQ